MRVFLCFLVGISLTLGDKLDRTYLPPPGSKFSGGSDGDLLGPLDYSRPFEDRPGSRQPGFKTPISNVSTQFGQQRPSDQGFEAKESFGQIPSGTRRPYQETQKGFLDASVAPTGSDQGLQTENGPLSRLPIPGIRANTEYPVTSSSQRPFTTPKFSSTNAPSIFNTQAPFDFDPSEGVTSEAGTAYQPSKTSENYPFYNMKVIDINTSTTPVGEQAADYEKRKYRPSQRVSKPESTERYPQENNAGQRDYYNQESRTTARPSTFASKDQSYYSTTKPTVPAKLAEPKSERPAQYSEEYPEQAVSGQKDFNRQRYPTTARPTTFASKDRTYYPKSETVAPPRVVTQTTSERPTQYSEEYPQQNEFDEINYYRQGTSTAKPTTFAPKDQTYYSKQETVAPFLVVTEPKSERPIQYTEQYPQEIASDENNFYRQGTSTIRPNTFTPEEQSYYTEKELLPSQRPDTSRVKSGRPTFGKPTYTGPTSRPVQPESDNYDQYSTISPETEVQENNRFEGNRKTTKPFSPDHPSIVEPKAAMKSQYTTASPFNDVTDADFEEGLAKTNENYGQNIPIYTDPQDVKPLAPTVPAFRNQEELVPEYKKSERPQADGDRNAVIINYQNEITPEGNFAYNFDTSNGIHADESGTASDGVKAQGEFSYTGDDGKLYSVIYSADENGFQPRGDHLPTPPPIPEAILRVIEQAQREKEAGISNDGSYDETKYGYKNYNGAVFGQPKLLNKAQEAFVTKNGRPIYKPTQGQFEPITGKEEGDDDSKDYLDVEKAEDETYPEGTSNQDNGDQFTNQYSTRRPINKIVKPNQRTGAPQKQNQYGPNAPEGNYYASRRPTVEARQDDEETFEKTTASVDQEVYPNASHNGTTPTTGRIPNKYDSSRRVPTNVVKGQDVTSEGYVSADNDEEERVPSLQKGIKVGPTKSAVKFNRFPEQRRRPNVDASAYDDSTQDTEDKIYDNNETPDRYITQKTRVQTTPTGNKNQGQFVTQKYRPDSRVTDEVSDSEKITPAEKIKERYYDTVLKEQGYPTQKFSKPTNVKVDDFGREIESGSTDEDTSGFGEQLNTEDFDSINPTSNKAQKKIASINRYNQRPVVAQESGYDYIPPRNKFIQEPSRTPTKYTTDGKKIVSPNAPSDISSFDEDDEIAEQHKYVPEDKPYNGPINPVTGKPRTKPASKSPIDSEDEFQKQYNKLFGQEPVRYFSVTSTEKPFFPTGSRVTYKPNEGTGFADDEISADEKETIGGDFIRKDDEIQGRPTKPSDQNPSTRTYSRPGFNQELRPNGEERETTGGDYNRSDEEIKERPTQSFERPTSDRRPPSRNYNKTSRPGFDRVRPNEYKVPSTTYRPVFSVPVSENGFDDSNYPTESSKAFENENKNIPSNINLDKNTQIRPVSSTSTPETDGSRFVTETKTIGEDFSGPQRPQYYNPETGYHY